MSERCTQDTALKGYQMFSSADAQAFPGELAEAKRQACGDDPALVVWRKPKMDRWARQWAGAQPSCAGDGIRRAS